MPAPPSSRKDSQPNTRTAAINGGHRLPRFSPVHFSPAQERLVLRLLGTLSRPALNSSHQKTLQKIIRQPHWQPIPPIASAHLMEPLYLHHLLNCGISPDAVFQNAGDLSAIRSHLSQLGTKYLLRRRVMHQALHALSQKLDGKVMLIKGAALESLYPTPALRQMCDLDLVIEEHTLPAAGKALESLGWERRPTGAQDLWHHSSGLLIDFHHPHSEMDRHIFDTALPHPEFKTFPVHWPEPAHHLVILALHAARNCGNRLWRDVCDAQLLLPVMEEKLDISYASQFAANWNAFTPFLAFTRFLNRYANPPVRLPERTLQWNAKKELRCRERHFLYRRIAVEQLSPMTLNLVRFSLQFPIKALSFRKKQEKKAALWERDPQLGDLPPQGTMKRHLLKLRILWMLFLSGRLRYYIRLTALQQRIFDATRKPFA